MAKIDNKKWYVYDHVFPNQKHYIGITCQDPIDRWGKNGLCYRNQPVGKAIEYFGWDNIEHHILYQGLDIQEAQQIEKELIQKYNSKNNGYNCTNGGDHCFEFDYQGRKMSSEELANLSPHPLSGHDITNRINEHGWDIEKTLNTPLQTRNTKYELDGEFYTLGELYDHRINKDLSYRNIAVRLIRHKWDVKRAVSQPLNKKVQPFGVGKRLYEYNDKMYNSYELSQIHPELGLTSFDITDRINHHGWDIERAISQPKRTSPKKQQ